MKGSTVEYDTEAPDHTDDYAFIERTDNEDDDADDVIEQLSGFATKSASSTSNKEKLEVAYAEQLAARTGEPLEKVMRTIRRLIPDLAQGKGQISPALESACRRLGIKPTKKAILEYLKG
jgi:hypothetical protein